MKYVIIGSAIDGNRGAASMLEAAIQTLGEIDPSAEFTLLSMYPEADSMSNRNKNLSILPAKPLYLGLVINPLAVIYKLLPQLRPLIRKHKQVGAIVEADVFLDQGGTTFTDGREVFLIYNIASILPAFLVGTPVVKCSQAMGPFNGLINRTFAQFFLPYVKKIYSRGQETYKSLKKLKLDNVDLAADYAFSMEVHRLDAIAADKLIRRYGYDENKRNVGIFPSEVIRKKTEKKGQNYEEIIAKFIDEITIDQDLIVYLVAHSQRSSKQRHNNDLPVCESIYTLIKNRKQCAFIKELSSPQELRRIIGKMDINVTARFHAMVSSLSMETPVLVTAWSHKYQEVLNMFELKNCAFDVRDISTSKLLKEFYIALEEQENTKNSITKNLQYVKDSSRKQVEGIVSLAQKTKGKDKKAPKG